MPLENISADTIAAARQGRIWPLMWIKQALNERLPVQEAFAYYRQTLGIQGDQSIRQLPIRSLGETAAARRWPYFESAARGRPFVNEPSRVIGEGDHRTLECATRSAYVAQIPDALLRGRSAFVEVNDAMLLDYEGDELERIDQELELDPAIFLAAATSAWVISRSATTPPRRIDEAFNLIGPNTWAFGHWLIEYLPKFVAAVRSGALPAMPVLIDQGMPRQHRQALELIAGTDVELIEVANSEAVRVRRLWCAPTLRYCPVLPKINERFKYDFIAAPPDDFAQLAREMARHFPALRVSDAPRKVYFSRRRQNHRKLVNQAEIESAARAQGFEVVSPEDLDFIEQLRLVANADYVVGPEGSALLLAFFAKPGTRLCVLNHPHTALLPALTALMTELGMDCTVVTGPYERFVPEYPHFSDYRIDEGGFADFLRHWPSTGTV